MSIINHEFSLKYSFLALSEVIYFIFSAPLTSRRMMPTMEERIANISFITPATEEEARS